jgi:hypothetical protein
MLAGCGHFLDSVKAGGVHVDANSYLLFPTHPLTDIVDVTHTETGASHKPSKRALSCAQQAGGALGKGRFPVAAA